MSLTRSDFDLTDDELKKLNSTIQKAVSDRLANSPDEDPPDALSVTFNFIFGVGRDLEINLAGLSHEVPD
jgi:hypothetical protein